jgi:hypothetical protein
MKEDLKTCPECGAHFENSFEAVDHLLEEDEEFDPSLILPNGYRLMIGSLLRSIYEHAHEPAKVEELTEDTYMTLFMVEMSPDSVSGIIQDIIVTENMADLDNELKELLEDREG